MPAGDSVGTPQERWETRWDSGERPGEPLPIAIRVTLGRVLAGQILAEDEEPRTLIETIELNLKESLEVGS